MSVRFRKKITRQRGSSTHGWGSKKKHRGGGSLGGRGMSGYHKHKFSFVVSKDPEHFGYKGFTSIEKKDKTINIDDMKRLMNKSAIPSGSQKISSSAELMKDGAVDLVSMGYGKLLSRGKIDKAVTVRVRKFSAKAKEKIEAAGGNIVSE
ncbi:MAG: uL15 family ribosomal protein [Candidatus Aenigmarchaeota archaeon]|nr:uL15 family ribosomal protein [Candidatus Aenigmarchaeota archaeon]